MNVLALGGARGTVTMTNLKPDHPFFFDFSKTPKRKFQKRPISVLIQKQNFE